MNQPKEACCFPYNDNKNFADTENNCTTPFEYIRTNVWNSSFSAPEVCCDMEILHSDLQEIKELVKDIKDCLKNFFGEE